MLLVSQAETIILNLVKPLDKQRDIEVVSLTEARDRILGVSVMGNLDFPYWDNSAMDGYALRFADVKDCSIECPSVLEIVEEIPAGSQPQCQIKPRQAARILTGSMMPVGTDTVVMQEETKREGDRLFISTPPTKPQEFVRLRGSFYQAGTPLLVPGIRLNAAEIAVLATAQCTQVSVYRRPRVALLSTGSELVMPDQPLEPGKIVDSNQYALATLVEKMGAIPQMLGIVADEPQALKEAIASSISKADVVISSGGVSVGDCDYVERTLEKLGAEIQVKSVAVKPGKPLTVATFNRENNTPILYFGLPGNPVSALVSFWRFVQPAIAKLSGLAAGGELKFVKGRSRCDLLGSVKRETYLWGQLQIVDGLYEFDLAMGSHSSGNLINLAGTNALAVVPLGQEAIASGEFVQILPISN